MAMASAASVAALSGSRVLPSRPCRRSGAVVVHAASTRMPHNPSSSQPKSKDGLETGAAATILATLGLTGATIGTYMDGIHSRVGVLEYDVLSVVHGSLHTSAVVPPLLAAYYVVLGGFFLKADAWLLSSSDEATEGALRRCNLGTMCLSFGSLAATLALSSVLYANDVPADQLSLALAGCAAANYLLFDSTKQGLALALLCAVACPASELMLMHILQLWHYPTANLFTEIPHSGIPSWVPWCYFAYTPAVAQLTRFLRKTA